MAPAPDSLSRRALVAALPLAAAGCRTDPASARGTAERFLDEHFVRIDLRAALPMTAGVARRKVEDEIALVEGHAIDDGTRLPTVHYALVEERADGDAAVQLVYRASIAVADAEELERRWLVTVRREPEGWRVTNWQEFAE